MKIKIQILILIILPALPAFSQFSGFPDITPRPPEPATLKPDIRIGNEPSSSRGYSYPGIRHPHHTDTYDYDSDILHRRNLINRKIIEEATAHIKERENASFMAFSRSRISVMGKRERNCMFLFGIRRTMRNASRFAPHEFGKSHIYH